MKGNSNLKQGTVFLMAFVLVVGLAGAGGLVYGETAESDVEVTVDEEEPIIDITSFPTDIAHDASVDIEVTVTAPGHDDAVDDFDIKFWYDGTHAVGETDEGDENLNIDSTELDWTAGGEDEGIYTETFTPDTGDDSVGWRYADGTDTAFDIDAEVRSAYSDHTDTDSAETSVLEYISIDSVQDGEATGQPGQTLEGEDFVVPGDDPDEHPKITVTANSMWTLAFDDAFTLVGPGADITGEDTAGGYEGSTGDLTDEAPVDGAGGSDSGVFDIHYWVDIPYGQEAGEYTTAGEGGTPVTHTLSNAE